MLARLPIIPAGSRRKRCPPAPAPRASRPADGPRARGKRCPASLNTNGGPQQPADERPAQGRQAPPPAAPDHGLHVQTQEKRADDKEEIAIKRYKTYEKSSEPVIDYYKQSNLLKVVNGEAGISEINSEISGLIDAIKG